MTDQEIYERWTEHMTNGRMKFTDNEHVMRMITSFISPEEAAFTTGFPLTDKTIEEIAEEKGVDLGALALEQAEERLAQAVEDGVLTQEEADEKLEAIKEMIESGEFDGFHGPRGGGERPFRCGPKAP